MNKPITDTPYGMEKIRILGVLFEVLPERKDEIINRSGRRENIVPPNGLQNLFPGYDLVFALD